MLSVDSTTSVLKETSAILFQPYMRHAPELLFDLMESHLCLSPLRPPP
jgi:hypothetical protein